MYYTPSFPLPQETFTVEYSSHQISNWSDSFICLFAFCLISFFFSSCFIFDNPASAKRHNSILVRTYPYSWPEMEASAWGQAGCWVSRGCWPWGCESYPLALACSWQSRWARRSPSQQKPGFPSLQMSWQVEGHCHPSFLHKKANRLRHQHMIQNSFSITTAWWAAFLVTKMQQFHSKYIVPQLPIQMCKATEWCLTLLSQGTGDYYTFNMRKILLSFPKRCSE